MHDLSKNRLRGLPVRRSCATLGLAPAARAADESIGTDIAAGQARGGGLPMRGINNLKADIDQYPGRMLLSK